MRDEDRGLFYIGLPSSQEGLFVECGVSRGQNEVSE